MGGRSDLAMVSRVQIERGRASYVGKNGVRHALLPFRHQGSGIYQLSVISYQSSGQGSNES
jgi:hypothetical protein